MDTTTTGTLADMRLTRVVTTPRGSWRWQQAYRLATYAPAQTRRGRMVWRRVEASGKISEPQMRRCGITATHGGLHMRRVTDATIREAARRAGLDGDALAAALAAAHGGSLPVCGEWADARLGLDD